MESLFHLFANIINTIQHVSYLAIKEHLVVTSQSLTVITYLVTSIDLI